MDKKNISLWTLYDFANSIVIVVFFLYFSQWLVVEKGVSDFWYNMVFALGSALLLLTAPAFGSLADKNGRHQKYFNRISILMFLCFLGTALIALFLSHNIILAVLFFLLANYLYQFSFVFYNAFLGFLAPREKQGLISGIGQAGNWAGQMVGLLITIPFASGAVYLVGEAGRAQTFLPAVVLFIILATPMLLFFKLPSKTNTLERASLKEEYKNVWSSFKELVRERNMRYFLLAYLFFNDAITTVLNNFPIFLENVFSVSDYTKSLILIGGLATSVLGALFSGFVSDRVGLRKTLLVVIGSWVILLPLLGLLKSFYLFVLSAVLMGFLFGAIWTVTRAVMASLTPPHKLNFGFSFYTLAERVSTFLGPITWGLITSVLYSLGADRYRVAIASMAVFAAIGFYFIRKVSIKEILPE